MLTRNYEFLLMSDAALTDEENQKVIDKFKELITKNNGKVLDEAAWGRRRLPYVVQKKTSAIYHILYLEATGEIIEELETNLGYDDNVLKYFIVGINDVAKAKADFLALKENPLKTASLITESIGV